MFKKIKNSLMAFSLLFAMAAPAIAAPVLTGVANADIRSDLCTGSTAASGNGSGTSCGAGDLQNAGTGTIQNIAHTVVNIISVVVGVLAVIFIIVAGFKYITSGGDSNKVGSAKNTLIYAIVGLIIVALAQVVVNFVVNSSTNVANNQIR